MVCLTAVFHQKNPTHFSLDTLTARCPHWASEAILPFLLQWGAFTDLVVLPRIFLQTRRVKLLCGQVPEMREWKWIQAEIPPPSITGPCCVLNSGGINNVTVTASLKWAAPPASVFINLQIREKTPFYDSCDMWMDAGRRHACTMDEGETHDIGGVFGRMNEWTN